MDYGILQYFKFSERLYNVLSTCFRTSCYWIERNSHAISRILDCYFCRLLENNRQAESALWPGPTTFLYNFLCHIPNGNLYRLLYSHFYPRVWWESTDLCKIPWKTEIIQFFSNFLKTSSIFVIIPASYHFSSFSILLLWWWRWIGADLASLRGRDTRKWRWLCYYRYCRSQMLKL